MDEAQREQTADAAVRGIKFLTGRPAVVGWDADAERWTCLIGNPAGVHMPLAPLPPSDETDPETEAARLTSFWVRQFSTIDRLRNQAKRLGAL